MATDNDKKYEARVTVRTKEEAEAFAAEAKKSGREVNVIDLVDFNTPAGRIAWQYVEWAMQNQKSLNDSLPAFAGVTPEQGFELSERLLLLWRINADKQGMFSMGLTEDVNDQLYMVVTEGIRFGIWLAMTAKERAQ